MTWSSSPQGEGFLLLYETVDSATPGKPFVQNDILEAMIMIPEGMAGSGGYLEHDILLVTEIGAENLIGFPFGPEHNIIQK